MSISHMAIFVYMATQQGQGIARAFTRCMMKKNSFWNSFFIRFFALNFPVTKAVAPAIFLGSLRGVVANLVDCDIAVIEV